MALYFFSGRKGDIRRVLKETSSGGVSIYTTVMHTANPHLPFGGVGSSGMGCYHGKAGFEAFSHKKSVFNKSTFVDPNLIYPPYINKIKLVKRFIG